MGRWRKYETTADEGLEVWANSLEDLFETAGKAFAWTVTDPSNMTPYVSERMYIEEDDLELAFREFLGNLLYNFDVYSWVPVEFVQWEFGNGRISVLVMYDHWKKEVHESKTDIKAVTYHELLVEYMERQWHAIVVFDI